MMENIDRYLEALTTCNITGATPKELRLNGHHRLEYEKEMGKMYEAFRLEMLSGLYTVPEFIGITRKVEEAKKQVISFQRLVERTDTSSPMFRPLQAFCGYYRRQVEKTAELVESVNIMKLTQAASVSQPALSVKESVPESQPKTPEETTATPTIAPAPEKVERRNLNDKNTSHPDEYWGYEEMMEGEGISRAKVAKIVKDPYFIPARRYVGKSLRVTISKLHELQQKQSAERHKPIGANPRRGKK